MSKRFKFITLVLLVIITRMGYSQTKSGISYQALITKDKTNIPGFGKYNYPSTNTNVCFKFSIVNETNQVEYIEEQQISTDQFGMVNIIVGRGDVIGNSNWDLINWANSPKYLRVEIDYSGSCRSFEDLSYQELTAVPYALNTAEDGKSAYDTWLELGYNGSQQEFIDFLKGEKGDQGVGIDTTIDNNDGTFTINYSDGS